MAIFGSASGGAFVGFTPNNKHDLKGDELYFESLLKADDKMARIDAASKPNLDQYDKDLEKLKALPGEKAFLHAQYKNVLSGLQEGANQNGGWLRYAQSDDFKEKISKLNNWTFNTSQAEQNYEAYEHLMKTAKPTDMDALYIDGNGNERVIYKGDKQYRMTNKEYLNAVARGIDMNDEGRLNALPISLNLGDRANFMEDVNKAATNLGHDKFESPFKIISDMAQTSKGAIDYMQAGTTTSTNNKRQREAAAIAVLENLSDAGRNGVRRSWIERGKPGKFNDFVYDEAVNALSVRRVNESTNNMGVTKVGAGATEDFGDNGYFGALFGTRANVTRAPVSIPSSGIDEKGKPTNNNTHIIYPQSINSELEKAFPKGKPVTGAFIFQGVTHDEFGGEGKGVNPGNLTYGDIKGVESRYYRYNPSTGRYDHFANNKELVDAGVLGTNLKPRSEYLGQEYRLIPTVAVTVKGKVGDILAAGGNLNGVVTDEHGKSSVQPFIDNGTWAKWGPHISNEAFANQPGVSKMYNDKNTFNIEVDNPDEKTFTRGWKTADVTALVYKPLEEASTYYDPNGASLKYSGMVDAGWSKSEDNSKRQMMDAAATVKSIYSQK